MYTPTIYIYITLGAKKNVHSKLYNKVAANLPLLAVVLQDVRIHFIFLCRKVECFII